ncbi:MAG: prenyltransferase [Bacteroidales bacterium]|nr:prenyltransferase [Bacteroidales bacterium]
MKKHSLGQWLFAVRPWSFPASAMPILVTLAYLFWTGAEMNWGFGVWALINMVLFHVAGNVWSDYNDYKKSVDREDTTGATTLTSGMFQPHEIRNLAIGVFVVAAIGGVGLVLLTGLPLLWIGLAGAVLTLLYPVLKYNALGDLDILLTFAFLPTIGTAFVTTGAIDWSVLLIALPVGLITDGILHSNNTRDMVPDKRAEIKTLAMGLGAKASAVMYSFEVLFPFVWVIVCVAMKLMPWPALAALVAFPIALGCSKTMMKSPEEGAELILDLDQKTAQLQMVFSLLLSIAFVISKFVF